MVGLASAAEYYVSEGWEKSIIITADSNVLFIGQISHNQIIGASNAKINPLSSWSIRVKGSRIKKIVN